MWRSAVLAFLAMTLGACTLTAQRAWGPDLARARAKGTPLLIYALGVPGEIETTDYKTAVPVYVQFIVTGNEAFKRVTFMLSAYSQRGIRISQNGVPVDLRLIAEGTFDPAGNYEVNSFHSDPAGFPGGDVACIRLAGIQIVYPDGRRQFIGTQQLNTALLPPLRGRCIDRGPVVERVTGGG